MASQERVVLAAVVLFVAISIVLTLFIPYNIFASLHFLAAVIGLLLIFLISFHLEGKSRIFFAFAILFSVFWSIGHFKAMTLPRDALWGAKVMFSLDMVFITFMASFIGLFTFYFDREKIPIISAVICLLPISLSPFLMLLDLVSAEYVPGYGWDAIQNPVFFIPYIAIVSIPAIYGLYNLYNVRKSVRGRNKQNITLLMLGLFFALFVSETIDGILHPFFNFPSLGSVGITVGLLIMCIPYLREMIS